MKKSLCLLSVALFALSSCSKDKEPDTSGIFPKTVKYTDGTSARDNYTATFTYDGNKIKILAYDNGSKKMFTYTGDVITKVEEYNKENAVQSTTTFIYDNNKLKSYLETRTYSKYRVDYTYNSNGTISSVSVAIDSRGVERKDSSYILTLDKGNIVKMVSDDRSLTVEYDTKNNPYKNILGYTSLLDSDVLNDSGPSTINNPTKAKATRKDINGVISETNTAENTYDSNNFLTKALLKYTRNGVYDSKRDQIYEYTY